ncbi:DUF6415 family natural product biosynthesis protein [Streptomyces sp. MBT62]|uniref:DUF6415 family natural product biosynthesis protein n=1 Tax=Streptomyces sp. MBT62 TaxID=2800410 RepID=UPI00190B8EF8|nr:DUF6415 family natural product biosynthesis protein [Streptomyces sp. MBT62]MBK3571659.1 hypothetical protein [Streptomyces sp. MBT62]
MTNGTALPKPEVKMTIRVYSVNGDGTVTEDRGVVNILAGQELPLGSAAVLPCRCYRCAVQGDRASDASSPKAPLLPDIAHMRADAAAFLAGCVPLPRYEDVQGFAVDCQRNLLKLIPEVEQLAGSFPDDDIPAKVAQAGVAEARRRLHEIEAVGLAGEVKRVQRLARSVLALCDHHDSLTG